MRLLIEALLKLLPSLEFVKLLPVLLLQLFELLKLLVQSVSLLKQIMGVLSGRLRYLHAPRAGDRVSGLQAHAVEQLVLRRPVSRGGIRWERRRHGVQPRVVQGLKGCTSTTLLRT